MNRPAAVLAVFSFLLTVVITVLALVIAPDALSLLIVGLMILLMAVGGYLGMYSSFRFALGFQAARRNIAKVMQMEPEAPWLYVQQNSALFQQKTLDGMFKNYVTKAHRELQDGKIVSDVDDIINRESLSLRSWQTLVHLIPGTMTALGLAGTFIGLVFGISSIGFSSVDATIGSIEIMLGGIRTAFYTSIVGVVFSILFNFTHRLFWNIMLRELGLFLEDFHLFVLPSTEEQLRQKQDQDLKKVLALLERLPRAQAFPLSSPAAEQLVLDAQNEQQLLADIQNGLQNGEFIFHVQPRCDLASHELVGGEALMRWNHSKMGMVSPAAFLPALERNGYIARIDRHIWELVCKELRGWLDSGLKPLPISINISKTDVLTMDVPAFFAELTKKYRIPPKYLELEFACNAFLQATETMAAVEKELHQSGFRVVVDGFNGDFAAMNVLKDADVDAIKLDLRYTNYEDGAKKETIAAIIDMARSLHVPMTVEGIETPEEVNILRRCGFTEGQGYQLHRPMPTEQFRRMVEEQQ